MALWGKRDQYSDAPLFTSNASNGASAQDEYGTNVYGVDATEAGVADKGIAPGWVKVRRGSGQLTGVAVAGIGDNYANTDTFTIAATSGANATGTMATFANGSIANVTISNYGGLFQDAHPTVTITTSTGSDANLYASVSGRAGRVTYETLVAIASMATDATSFSNTSESAVANTTGTADDTVFPDS